MILQVKKTSSKQVTLELLRCMDNSTNTKLSKKKPKEKGEEEEKKLAKKNSSN